MAVGENAKLTASRKVLIFENLSIAVMPFAIQKKIADDKKK